MSITEQIAISTASTNGAALTLNGYDVETGNEEINATYSFSANTTTVNGGITLALTAANLQAVYLLSNRGGTLTTNGGPSADVQTISITGTPTGGSFPVAFNGAITSIPYNANAAQCQTLLAALSTVGSGNITCNGAGALPGNAIVCTFAGSKNSGQQVLMTTYSGSLTGGTTPTVTIAHTTPGLPTNTIPLVAGCPFFWGTSTGWGANPFSSNVSNAAFSCSSASNLQIRILSL